MTQDKNDKPAMMRGVGGSDWAFDWPSMATLAYGLGLYFLGAGYASYSTHLHLLSLPTTYDFICFSREIPPINELKTYINFKSCLLLSSPSAILVIMT